MLKLEELKKGFKDEEINLTSLFFADNGMVITWSIKDAKRVVKCVIDAGKQCGLEINKNMSNIIIFNSKNFKNKYVQYILREGNELLQKDIEEMRMQNKENRWLKGIHNGE